MLRLVAVSGCVVLLCATANAGETRNSGAAEPDLMIGAITTYRSRAEADAACGRDPVVWADRYAGYYYWPREKQFAATGQGAYACLHNAQHGNYWDTSPMSSMAHSPGREFPYTPLYVGS